MKRFQFTLRPVAVLRAHQEVRAREAFGAAVHAYVVAEEEHDNVRRRVAQYEAALFSGRRERFSAAEEARALAAYRHECEAEAASERALIAARAEMARCRSEYLEAHRKLEVIERLETQARGRHRYETAREEQAAFDDFAGRRSGRGSPLAV
jgi:flagellar FliJ protein